ncbi:hypothetical protein D9M70_490450 [compost metagenome]
MHEADAHLLRFHQDFEAGHLVDVGTPDLGPTRDGDGEVVGEAVEIDGRAIEVLVAVDAEGLLVQRILRHVVEMVDRRHRPPADIERRMHVGLRPIEDALQFVPIGDVLVFERLDRRAGDDEAVKLAALHLVPGLVERKQVIFRGVLRPVGADAHQRQFHLQR